MSFLDNKVVDMDELKKQIDLPALSDETIAEKKYALSDLWMAKDENNEVFGPYPTDELREYSQKYKYLFDNVKVYNLETEKWYNIFEVKYFQRRKPQLVSAQNLISDNDFYVIINGQKQGPYTLEKMQSLLDTGSILASSQISLDKGQSWIKLYEHHAFDRRSKKKTQDLPFVPGQEVMSKHAEVVPREDDSDPLVELANLKIAQDEKTKTQINRAGIMTKTQIMRNPLLDEDKTIVGEKISPIEVTIIEEDQEKSKLAVILASIVLIAAIGFGGTKAWQIFSRDLDPSSSEVTTQTKSIDNTDRSIQKNIQIQRQPASVDRRRAPVKIKAKRYVPKPTRVERRVELYNEPAEPLDVNDPDVQEELTRSLAGDLDEEGYPVEDRREEYVEPEENFQDEYRNEPPAEEYYEEAPQAYDAPPAGAEVYDYDDAPYDE